MPGVLTVRSRQWVGEVVHNASTAVLFRTTVVYPSLWSRFLSSSSVISISCTNSIFACLPLASFLPYLRCGLVPVSERCLLTWFLHGTYSLYLVSALRFAVLHAPSRCLLLVQASSQGDLVYLCMEDASIQLWDIRYSPQPVLTLQVGAATGDNPKANPLLAGKSKGTVC